MHTPRRAVGRLGGKVASTYRRRVGEGPDAEISRPPEAAAVPEPEPAVVGGPSEPAAGTDAVPEAKPVAGTQAVPPPPRPPQRPAPEVLDLGAASREAVLKRAAPVLAGLLALLVVLGLRRRR